MKKFIIMLVGVFSLALTSSNAQAASSGCYRWHSCPSATGSYVCGDTGHCSECPDNQYCAAGLPRGSASVPLPNTPPKTVATSTGAFVLGVRTKTSSCVVNGSVQDSACTPGAVFKVTAKQVCKSGYSKSVRNVTTKVKNQVFKEYGVKSHPSGAYEVDHLISLELGGSNDIANLWPEAASPKPGFHEKDKVENYLHSQVCKGAMTLSEAQKEISTDWLGVYRVEFSK